jgi:hypothetical protein
MKKILFLLSLLISISAFGQIPALNNLVGSNPPNSALIKRALDGSKSFTVSGTNTYTVATGLNPWPGGATYGDGDILNLLIPNANSSTTVTLNADSEGASAVKDQSGNDLAVGDLKSGGTYIFRHNGTHWRVLNVEKTAITREFSRTWTDVVNFDKNEIFYLPHELDADVDYEIGIDNLIDQPSAVRQRIITDGTHAINFGTGFDFIYGIQNGEIPSAGTYEIYFLYTNGSVAVNFPGVSSEESSGVQLSIAGNFSAVADGENAIDLSWDNVTNNQGYLVEFSLTGTGGWSTLETTAIDATASTQTALAPGDTRFYRIKTLGNGSTTFDSGLSDAISATTESSGDVTDPAFTFLPTNGTATWTVNRPIVITADEGIRNTDGSEITNANVSSRITLKQTNSGGANISFSATIDGTKTVMTITPTTQYGENQLVYVAVNNVEDVNGNEVTSAQSVTFTTTEYTFFNGSDQRLVFGDIMDAVFSASSVNFRLGVTVNNMLLSGIRPLVTKYDATGNQRSFQWYASGSDVYFGYVGNVNGNNGRVIKWTGVLTSGEHDLEVQYDGSINTNNGLDRATLLIDGVTAGSKTLASASTTLIASIANSTAQLSVGTFINNAGTPIGTSFYTEEMKDFFVESTGGTVTEINVPNLRLGTDTSGNSRNGTWAP